MSQQRISVPIDLNKIKSKFMFGLTKRQLVCFSLGIASAIPIWLVTRHTLPTDISTLCIVFTIAPFFICAMYEKNGQRLEQILFNFIKWKFIFPQKRKRKKGGKINEKSTDTKTVN